MLRTNSVGSHVSCSNGALMLCSPSIPPARVPGLLLPLLLRATFPSVPGIRSCRPSCAVLPRGPAALLLFRLCRWGQALWRACGPWAWRCWAPSWTRWVPPRPCLESVHCSANQWKVCALGLPAMSRISSPRRPFLCACARTRCCSSPSKAVPSYAVNAVNGVLAVTVVSAVNAVDGVNAFSAVNVVNGVKATSVVNAVCALCCDAPSGSVWPRPGCGLQRAHSAGAVPGAARHPNLPCCIGDALHLVAGLWVNFSILLHWTSGR